MILFFDVKKFIPFVPADHADIKDTRLYVYDSNKSGIKKMWELLRSPENEIELFKVLSDGNIQKDFPIKFKIKEIKPAWTSVKTVNDVTVNIIFE